MDSLSDQLNTVNVGCEYNGILYNHLMYADDTVLIAPSPRALKTLNTSVSFAQENDLIYNKTKTKVMTITPRCMKNLFVLDYFSFPWTRDRIRLRLLQAK